MKVKFLCFFIALVIIVCSCSADKTYTDKEIGFSFTVPKNCTVGTDGSRPGYFIRVYVDNPEDLPDGIEQFNQIKKDIENDQFPSIPGMPFKLLGYSQKNNLKIGIGFFKGYDMYDGVIGKNIIFIKNEKLVQIYFQYEFTGPDSPDDDNIKNKFQRIFRKYVEDANKVKPEAGYETLAMQEMEKDIKSGELKDEIPEEISTMFTMFDEFYASFNIK